MLCGILFVLYTGIRWEFLPQELGFGSGMTCWRRLRDRNGAGVRQRLHELLLSELRPAADLPDFSRAAVDCSHTRAMKGGSATGPSPVDRGKAGSKHHLIVEAHGIPLAAITTGGNRNDVTQLIPLIQAVPPIRGKRWVVEGAIALLHWFRRLRTRWETRDDIHHAFATPGCAVICRRRLRTALCREQGQAMRPRGWPARCVRTHS